MTLRPGGLHQLSRVGTPEGVLGTVWAVTGQHSCGSPGGCMGSHGSALLWESWGLYGQSWVSTPVGVLGAFGEVMGQHRSKICLSRQKFCLDKHTFVATEDMFCHNKHVFVATKLLSQQK